MLVFDDICPEVARRDSRAIHLFDRAGRQQTFAFREYFCDAPRCDCRRVVLAAEWIEAQSVAAVIHYAFEPGARGRGEPQVALDPSGPQSANAEALVKVFARMIAEDPAYRGRILEHYAMFKQAVDGRRPKARAAPKPKRAPRKEAAPAPAGPHGLQVLAGAAGRTDRKVQQRFGRLLKQVDQLKQRLRVWREADVAIHRERTAYAAVVEEHHRAAAELARLLDGAWAHPMFGKRDRVELSELITELAGAALVDGGHADLKPIYNRHSRSDFDADQAEENAAELSEMKAAIEDALGVDLGDADVDSPEALRELAAEQIRQLEAEREAASARRKKSPRQVVREAETAQVGKTLQDIYRKLAVALHPDLEQDAAERARKTELMQQVNAAYAAKDLLLLLELQLRFEQVDATKVDAIAEDRLRHYNQILDEQSKQLKVELYEAELPYRAALGLSPTARVSPEKVIHEMRADAADVKRRIALIRSDAEEFADVKRLKAWLKARRGEARTIARAGVGDAMWE